MSRLAGQVAVVTGATRGVGRGLALGLGRAGAAVALLGRDEDRLAEVAAELAAAGARSATAVADVTDRRALQRAVDDVADALGPPDLVCANAGAVEPRRGRAWEGDLDAWWHVVEVNVRGVLLTCAAVLPAMVARGRGRVLVTGSGVGQRRSDGWSAYAVSKAAEGRLVDELAEQLDGTGVVVLDASPGIVATDMSTGMWPELDAAAFGTVEPFVELAVAFGVGELDALAGRHVHAVKDDWRALAAAAAGWGADERRLRLAPYGPEDPLGVQPRR